MKIKAIALVLVVCISIMIYLQITLFVIQPIGAIPNGKTLVILKLNKTNFIDSADAMCIRETGSLSLLCRGLMMANVIKTSNVIFQLPYSSFLYKISTDGKTYSK